MVPVVRGCRVAASSLPSISTGCQPKSLGSDIYNYRQSTEPCVGPSRFSESRLIEILKLYCGGWPDELSIRCGFSPCACHTRRTLASLIPKARAIVRVLQCVALEGFSCVVLRTTSSGSIVCILPGREASFSIPRTPLIRMAISHTREFSADAVSARALGTAQPMIDALVRLDSIGKQIPLEAPPSMSHMYIMQPFTGPGFLTLSSTHPPLQKRIAALRALPLRVN